MHFEAASEVSIRTGPEGPVRRVALSIVARVNLSYARFQSAPAPRDR